MSGTDTNYNDDSDNDMDILGKMLEDDDLDVNENKDVTSNDIPENDIEPSCSNEKVKETCRKEIKGKKLRLTDLFSQTDTPSVVHTGDTDSSEDEDNKYCDQQRLSDYGRSVNHLIKETNESKGSGLGLPFAGTTGVSKTWKDKHVLAAPAIKTNANASNKLKSDPICGIRVINPIVSSAAFQDKLEGRKLVMMSYIQNHINNGDLDADWVTVGVIVQKSPVQKSQKGSQYCILTLSDLKIGLKKICLFLFSGSFKSHWKHPVGTVIGILNPNVLNNRDSGAIASLSVDNAQKIMVIGTSKDFGYCKSWKKNGEKCTSFVNMGDCEYCVYHVQKEYSKFSQRSELQSPNGGRLHDLRNKVLGKNEVFYGGRSFVASKKLPKSKEKDEQRLRKLSDFFGSSPKLETNFSHSPSVSSSLSTSIKVKDANRLSMLMESPSCSPRSLPIMPKESPSVLKSNTVTRGKNVLESLRNLEKKEEANPSQVLNSMKFSEVFVSPKLGRGAASTEIDLDFSFSKIQKNRAMSQALMWVKKNGPVKKNNPNAVRSEKKPKLSEDGKRKRESEQEDEISQNRSPNADEPKNKSSLTSKFNTEQMKELMEKKSKHAELLEIADLEAGDEYFDKLEKKEKMEEKMLNTFKLDCKAVRCLKCKYLAFSASDFCKAEGHPTKVVNAVKRFYKCHDCGNRTVSLELFPVMPCKQCGGAQWERAPMMREKKGPILPSEKLSIRGMEEKYVGAVQSDGNLNLLVPD